MPELKVTDEIKVETTSSGFKLYIDEDFGSSASALVTKSDAFQLVQWMMQQHILDPRLVARVKAYPIEGRPGKFKLEINGEMQSEVVDESNLQEAIQKLVDSHA
jgi:hypothetical protein